MEAHITFEYVAPGGSAQDAAEEIATFTDSEGTMKIPTENQSLLCLLSRPVVCRSNQKTLEFFRSAMLLAASFPTLPIKSSTYLLPI